MLSTSQVSDKRGQEAAPNATEGGSTGFARRGLLAVATMAALLTGFTGCMTVHNGFKAMTSSGTWNDTVIVLRNRNYSAKAWHRRKHHFCNEKHNKDFKAGFRAGYEAAANGSDGCTPSFPPKEYWSWEFQSAEGQQRTSAWFAGYPHGVRAAEEDGIVNWNQLQMGANLQAQYQQNGTFNHQGALYPIPDPNQQSYEIQDYEIQDGYVIPDDYPMGAPTPAFPVEEFELPPGAQLLPMPNE